MENTFSKTRLMNQGLLQNFKREEQKLRIQIDTIWKNVISHAEPHDYSFRYVERIDVTKLEYNLADLRSLRSQLDGVLKEIERLKQELGEE